MIVVTDTVSNTTLSINREQVGEQYKYIVRGRNRDYLGGFENQAEAFDRIKEEFLNVYYTG